MSSETPAHPGEPDPTGNKALMLSGQLYYSFSPALIADRSRCSNACYAFNSNALTVDRISRINLLNSITTAPPIPPSTPESTLSSYPWIEPPFHCDYGYNINLGQNVFINFNCTILDTSQVTIGSRTLIGPNVSLFAATHPIEAEVRNGTVGPESGKPIAIGEDCWLGGSVVVLQGVSIGDRSVVGAGSVVTRDVPEDCVVAGNPARVVRWLKEGAEERAKLTQGKKKVEVSELAGRLESLEKEMEVVKRQLEEALKKD